MYSIEQANTSTGREEEKHTICVWEWSSSDDSSQHWHSWCWCVKLTRTKCSSREEERERKKCTLRVTRSHGRTSNNYNTLDNFVHVTLVLSDLSSGRVNTMSFAMWFAMAHERAPMNWMTIMRTDNGSRSGKAKGVDSERGRRRREKKKRQEKRKKCTASARERKRWDERYGTDEISHRREKEEDTWKEECASGGEKKEEKAK